jgi:hypothetical protein
MTVSQMLPLAPSAVPPICSLFLSSLIIFPPGVWIASLAGFCALEDELDEVEEGLEYDEPV